ncbi:oligosaccharide flippase family protein [Microbacterium sp. ARD31]|uniref:lipopolysaccharide biosynthesis protein n=1 Tax=Microbacterium sp. ARD31 TaxID=2962576 RepID=UPI0028818F86|nr:oligosaccharide flippase family protein [Microbacterium sp. ARD31]MDT0183368.1 oligosaccharide flippase family protein [Microbacterium sp. ARD31]
MKGPSGAGRAVLAIISWTALGHLIALGVTPFLTRLYEPAEYGTFAFLVAVAAVLGTIPALRYEFAVPLPPEDDDARALVYGGFVLTAVFLLVAIPIAGFVAANGWIGGHVGAGDLLPFVPVLAAVYALFRLLNQWAIRQRQYSRSGRRNFLQSGATAVAQLGSGIGGASTPGLWWGTVAGQSLGVLSLMHKSGLGGPPRPADVLRNLRRYLRFSLVLAPSGLINALGIYVPVIMLTTLFSVSDAGTFGLAQQLLAVPLALVGQAIAQVYLGELSRRTRANASDLLPLFRSVSRRLTLIATLLLLVLLTLTPTAFSLVLGDEWRTSGYMAQALGISVSAQFVASPLSQTLIVTEQSVVQLAWDVARLVVTVTAFLVGHELEWSALECVWAYSTVSAGMYAVSWLLSRRSLLHLRRGEPGVESSQ